MTKDVDLRAAQKEAARVASLADIADVRLFRCDLRFERFPKESQSLSWEVEMTPSTQYEEGDDYFVLEVDYKVVIREAEESASDDESSGTELSTIEFTMAALYTLDIRDDKQDPTPDELDAYAKTMGTLALYPYSREFVQNMTSRMGFPPLTLSTIRLPYPTADAPADTAPHRGKGASRKPGRRASRQSTANHDD